MLLCQNYPETKITLNDKSYVSKMRWINMFVNKGVKVRGLVAKAPQTGFIPDIQISKLTKYFLKIDFQNNSFHFLVTKMPSALPFHSRNIKTGQNTRFSKVCFQNKRSSSLFGAENIKNVTLKILICKKHRSSTFF